MEYTRTPDAYGDIQTEAVFDRANDRCLLVNVGCDNDQRAHDSLAHIDIINGQSWVQRDNTEHGIAKELAQAGIPKDRMVLAFHAPEMRQYTEYAVT
jgi:hypothetical protein